MATAILFLGEALTVRATLSIMAIVSGVATLGWRGRKTPGRWPAWWVLLPLTAAFLRGPTQALTKVALELWPQPFMGVVIGYSVSALVVLAFNRIWTPQFREHLNRRGLFWFILVGACNGAAVLSMYAALKLGPVTAVAPVVATYPAFALIFGAGFLPNERITLQSLMGVTLTIAGVAGLLVR